MTKQAILTRKIIHAYNNPKNHEYSKFKGWQGYFGYSSLRACIIGTKRNFVQYYGKGLKKWRPIKVKNN